MIVKDFVVDNDIDLLAITETWLRPGNADEVEIGTLCPIGYRFLHVPRSHSKGGGVGILFKDNLRLNTSIAESYQTFELMDVRLRSLESTSPENRDMQVRSAVFNGGIAHAFNKRKPYSIEDI